MKRAHRTAHRLIWLILGPALAGLLWLAVTVRPDDPVNPALPDALPHEVG
jgi:hypothetical protein